MPEIKTREVVQGTIKTLDRSAVVGERMKNAYVKTKDKAEHSVYAAESSPEEYAADCIRDAATGTAQEVAYHMDKQRQKFIRRKAQERRQGTIRQDTSTAEAAPPSANDSPSAPQPTVPDAAPQPEIRPPRQGRTNSLRPDIKTIERSSEKIRQRVIPGKPVKNADRTIKTADRTVKTAARASETMKQTAQQTAKSAAIAAQKAQAAMKAAAAAVKTLAAATAKATKAIIASAQKLIAAICSGGVVAILSIIMVVMCFVGIMFASDENDTEILPVSDEVKAYEPIIQKYAKEHGIMINIAALASKGAPMPDGAAIPAPITVIYQCAEDDISDTIKPRLLAAGADCDKVAYIEEAGNVLSLDDDRIESVLKQTMARLLVLDPIQSFLSQDGDMQSAGRMRLILGKLSDIAARTHCAIVLIGHLNKSVGGKQLYRGLGSIDIAAIARSVLLIGRSKSDPDLRYMQPIKTSLAPEGKAISFSFQEDGSLEWNGYYEITEEDTEDFSSEPRRYSIAKQIIELLSGQDYPSTEILEMLGEIDPSWDDYPSTVHNVPAVIQRMIAAHHFLWTHGSMHIPEKYGLFQKYRFWV